MKSFLVSVMFALLIASAHTAQAAPRTTTFDQVRFFLKVGDRVSVRLEDGTHVKGTVTGVSASSLVLVVRGRQRSLYKDEVQRIARRRSDPVKDGALRGAGAAAIPALIGAGFVASAPKSEGGGRANATAVVLLYVGGGAAIDAVIVRRDVVYERPRP
jgi:hypothetical protein